MIMVFFTLWHYGFVQPTTVYVKSSLNLYPVPPRLEGPAVERVVETISNPVTFACDATGIPPPSLTWLKNGRVIGEIDDLQIT